MNCYISDTKHWILVAWALSCPAFRNRPSSFTFMNDGDLRVPSHESAILCKSVNCSLLGPSVRVENSSSLDPCGPMPPFLISILTLWNWTRVAYHIELVLELWRMAEQRECIREDMTCSWCIFSRESWSLSFFYVQFLLSSCLKTYLGFHLAHFQAAEERRAGNTAY